MFDLGRLRMRTRISGGVMRFRTVPRPFFVSQRMPMWTGTANQCCRGGRRWVRKSCALRLGFAQRKRGSREKIDRGGAHADDVWNRLFLSQNLLYRFVFNGRPTSHVVCGTFGERENQLSVCGCDEGRTSCVGRLGRAAVCDRAC